MQERVGRSPRTGGLFIFFNRRRTALKAIFAVGTGLCIFYKRLDRGRFQLPDPVDEGRVVELSEDQLDVLLDGIELPPPTCAREAQHDSVGPLSRQRSRA